MGNVVEKNEEYWHKKHPVVEQMYGGRPLPTGKQFEMDVRHFVWLTDITLQRIIKEHNLLKESNDETAWAIQKFVCSYLKYVGDKNIGSDEYWLFPEESIRMKQGDCEDGAILIASLLLNALPPEQHWRVRVAAGWVRAGAGAAQGGHAYVGYCRCSDNEWVILDWCYYQDPQVNVRDKPLAKNVERYHDIWFSFNHKHAYSHVEFAMTGRVRDWPTNGVKG